MRPAIIQDALTNRVLMLGYMNDEALAKTKELNRVTFYSRSKQRLWTKGETSGNYLILNEILLDCDNDTLLIKATPSGPVCHRGTDTCFGEENKFNLEKLEQVIADRKTNFTEASYTSSLFGKGLNAIVQKLGEETVELVIASKDEDIDKFLDEAADLLFHFLVLLQVKDLRLPDVTQVLAKRHK